MDPQLRPARRACGQLGGEGSWVFQWISMDFRGFPYGFQLDCFLPGPRGERVGLLSALELKILITDFFNSFILIGVKQTDRHGQERPWRSFSQHNASTQQDHSNGNYRHYSLYAIPAYRTGKAQTRSCFLERIMPSSAKAPQNSVLYLHVIIGRLCM